MKTKLLTLHEAAALLADAGLQDLGVVWLRNQIDRGVLPAVVVSRRRRVRRDVLEGIIQDWMRKAAV